MFKDFVFNVKILQQKTEKKDLDINLLHLYA